MNTLSRHMDVEDARRLVRRLPLLWMRGDSSYRGQYEPL